jgi:hypothetical protein
MDALRVHERGHGAVFAQAASFDGCLKNLLLEVDFHRFMPYEGGSAPKLPNRKANV